MGNSVSLAAASRPRRRFSWPWLRPIAEWFFCYPPLVLETAGLLLIVLAIEWDLLGAKQIGLPGLFWHHSVWIQLTAGFGIAAVVGEICLVGYLLDAEQKWMISRKNAPDDARPRTSWWYFFVTCTYPALLLIAALPAAFAPETRWPLPLGLLAGGTLVAALARFGRSIAPEKTGLFDWLLNLPQIWQRLPDEWQDELSTRGFILRLSAEERADLDDYFHLHAFQVFVSLALALVYVALYVAAQYWSAEFVSPALVICVLLALLTTAYGFIVFHFPLRHFGIIFLIVAGYLSAGSYVAPQYRFAGLNYNAPTVLADVKSGADAASNLLDNEDVLDAWRDARREELPAGRKPVLVVIATKGGGARSAAWTTVVLTALEKDLPQLPYHTRLISGVSGGMLGASYYVSTLNPPGGSAIHTIPGEKGPSHDPAQIVENISQDNLSPVVRHLALPLRGDRGEALERAWEKHTAGALARPLGELRAAEKSGWCPSLVFAPMLVEDGRRLLISNLQLDFLVHSSGATLSEPATVPANGRTESTASGWQFFELFPYATDVRLSTLARMNASFPYITPDAEIATSPPRRVVDAAYYDGYGVNLAALWIYHSRDWLRKNTAGVLLIEVRDRPRNFAAPSQLPGWRRALSRFTTPIEGALRARDATMSFRNDELVGILDEELNFAPTGALQDAEGDKPPDGAFFRRVIFEYPGRAPLSWYLPPEDLEGMKKEVGNPESHFSSRLRQLKKWWDER